MEIDNVTQVLYYGATEQPSIPQFTEQPCKAKVKKNQMYLNVRS